MTAGSDSGEYADCPKQMVESWIARKPTTRMEVVKERISTPSISATERLSYDGAEVCLSMRERRELVIDSGGRSHRPLDRCDPRRRIALPFSYLRSQTAAC